MLEVGKLAADLRGFRIAPGDGNDFACLLDPIADGAGFNVGGEIFAPGGGTPVALDDEDRAVLSGR